MGDPMMKRRDGPKGRRPEPYHLIYREEGKMEWSINPKACAMLEQIKGELGVIAIIGQYRSGKSYILNRLAGYSSGFALGHTVKGCTRGIWVWGEPVKLGGLNTLLLDVEGLSDPMREDHHSAKDDDVLFTLSVLLSSLFILNTTGTIDSKKFESLQVATNLSERIRVHDSAEEPSSLQIAEQMPFLLWVVRDFTLDLTNDMKSDDDYLEVCLKEAKLKPGKKTPACDLVKQCIKLYFPRRGCVTVPAPGTAEQILKLEQLPFEALDPKFRSKFPVVPKRIMKEIKPKKMGAHKGALVPVNGPRFVLLMKQYVNAINKGALPDVESAWQTLQKASCQEAVEGAKRAFKLALERGRLALVGNSGRALDHKEMESVTQSAFKAAFEDYKQNAVGEPQTTEDYLHQLSHDLAEFKDEIDGTKTVKGGVLKEFADNNYKAALNNGQNLLDSAVKTLGETPHEDFESFKGDRERAIRDVDAKLKKSVAYPELSEKFLQKMEDLSTKKGLQFDISTTEKEKEQALVDTAKKEIENEKVSAGLREAVTNTQQVKTNLQEELSYLREQSDREFREWKERTLLESKLREQQIIADLKNGYEQRADSLRKELKEKNASTLKMMMQMQKEANERQAKLTQFLTLAKQKQQQQQQQHQQQVQQQQGGGGKLLGGLCLVM